MIPASVGHVYDGLNCNTMSHRKIDEDNISVDHVDSNREGNIIPVGETYEQENNTFISVEQTYSKGDDNISVNQVLKENGNITIAMGDTFGKIDDIVILVRQTYKIDENAISMEHIYTKGDKSSLSTCQMYNKGDNSSVSICQSFVRGESTIISFGGVDDDSANDLGRLMSSHELLMAQPSLAKSEVALQKELIKTSSDELLSNSHITSCESGHFLRKKEDLKMSMKTPGNNLTSNVRCLPSTGILDGVPVQYITWS